MMGLGTSVLSSSVVHSRKINKQPLVAVGSLCLFVQLTPLISPPNAFRCFLSPHLVHVQYNITLAFLGSRSFFYSAFLIHSTNDTASKSFPRSLVLPRSLDVTDLVSIPFPNHFLDRVTHGAYASRFDRAAC